MPEQGEPISLPIPGRPCKLFVSEASTPYLFFEPLDPIQVRTGCYPTQNGCLLVRREICEAISGKQSVFVPNSGIIEPLLVRQPLGNQGWGGVRKETQQMQGHAMKHAPASLFKDFD